MGEGDEQKGRGKEALKGTALTLVLPRLLAKSQGLLFPALPLNHKTLKSSRDL